MENFKIILKGAWIGATMTVPGVSGGTMAVVTGIYEALIHAVNGLRNEPKKYIPFLLRFVLGAGIGFLLFARCITFLLENAQTGEATRFFFCGIVAGGIPLLVKKSKLKGIKVRHILCLVCGAAIVLALSFLPQGMFTSGSGVTWFLLQLAGGVLVAAALILPGISVTHMLYILGLYELVLEDVYALRFLPLLPLAVGVLIGTFLSADLLERLMERYTTEVYLVIIGFVAGSLVSLMPEGGIYHPFFGILAFAAGFVGMYLLSRRAG